jgi:hypothetical protein
MNKAKLAWVLRIGQRICQAVLLGIRNVLAIAKSVVIVGPGLRRFNEKEGQFGKGEDDERFEIMGKVPVGFDSA